VSKCLINVAGNAYGELHGTNLYANGFACDLTMKILGKKIKDITVVGLGRIGRHFVRELLELCNEIYICEQNKDLDNLCYLLNYDSVYGLRAERFVNEDNYLLDTRSNKKIKIVDLDDIETEYVIDSTGNLECLQRLSSLDSLVFTTNTPKQEFVDDYIIANVKETFDGNVISTSICDTTAIAPILSYLDRNYIIAQGHITTLHPWLNYQNLSDNSVFSTDAPSHYWKDYALGRKSTEAIIPKSTSAVAALEMVYPEIATKLNSWSFRVPTPVVSSALINCELSKKMTCIESFIEDIVNTRGVKISKNNLISTDYIGANANCIIDVNSVSLNNNHLYLALWYDNELGYVKQVLSFIARVEK
tara:strand:- start:39732 stop:40814 length:1083 start_codon:yes stop_codon:yes gene_type:complete